MTESNCRPLITKQVFYHLTNRAKSWSGIGESNSYDNLGKVTGNHYINPAFLYVCIIYAFESLVKHNPHLFFGTLGASGRSRTGTPEDGRF